MSKIDRTMVKYLKKRPKVSRLNLRLPESLLQWMREYAYRNNTTMTKLIEDHFRTLQKKDTEVPQI